MNNKKEALTYLSNEAKNMARIAKDMSMTQNIDNNLEVSKQMGILFSAMREVASTLQLDENLVEEYAVLEYNRWKSSKENG